jgi:hypothetical protein
MMMMMMMMMMMIIFVEDKSMAMNAPERHSPGTSGPPVSERKRQSFSTFPTFVPILAW